MADDNDRWIHAIPVHGNLPGRFQTMGADEQSLAGYEALLRYSTLTSRTPRRCVRPMPEQQKKLRIVLL